MVPEPYNLLDTPGPNVRDCTIIIVPAPLSPRVGPLSMASASRQHLNDRRSGQRYPVKAALEYRIVLRNRKVINGIGGTVNISSGGVLVQTASLLPRGGAIELSIAWPVRLNNTVALKLHVIGKTLRTQGNFTAIVIRRHEFRTSGMPS